ncbi:MAG: glycosyl hydrolase family 28 protein [Dysgonamonadaceae bacterium]|nr:glycosyl hydrolase family 28 protein [Dysgonamonadaceae bacterium]MDD3900702.1 glycosyl hydrolase family 28 protein [Dysgonamonadaceae bacterium]
MKKNALISILILTVCFLGLGMNGYSAQGQKEDKNRESLPETSSQIVTYPIPPGLETSPDFTVKINEKDVWTQRVGDGGMEDLNVTRFACAGVQTIKITSASEIKNYVIRPKSLNIKSKVNGRELTFSISGPQKLYIEIDSLPHLAIFADPLEVNPPKSGDAGVMYFAPGEYKEDVINLQSNQTIYIAAGAIVYANIRGSNLENVKIKGRGILHGNVRISGTSNLEVSDIFICHNSGGWTNTLTNCPHSFYRNVKVFSYKTIWGIDGINPVSCTDFLIDDCFVRTRDDCISIKSGRDREIKTDSITVKNCLLVGWQHADGVTLGFNIDGLMQNILVKNCDILYARGQGHTGGHAAFSIVCDNAGDVRNVRFEDIRVEENIEIKNLELIVTEGQRYGSNNTPGHVQGVYLKNIRWENEDKPFVIAGIPFDNHIVEDVTFDNCYVGNKLLTSMKDADFQVEFAKDIKFVK